MKKLTILLCVILAALAGACGYQLAHHFSGVDWGNQEIPATEEVAEEEIDQPYFFKTVEQILLYQADMIEGARVDSVFLSMPQQVLSSVAKVVLEKEGQLHKVWVVEEYEANKNIYDALSSSPPQIIVNGKLTDMPTPSEQPAEANKDDPKTVDTIINGKRYTQTE